MAEVVVKEETELETSEAETGIGTYTHEFRTPFTYEGKTYERLTFDFEKLTGRDSLAIEAELSARGKVVMAPEFSGEFLSRMAARACTEKIGADVIAALPFADFNRIRNRARSFLLRSGS